MTRTHGRSRNGDRTYMTWHAMKQRCQYKKHYKYPWYGGRGITVCERWQSFENFLEDMGERPEGMTLDRYPNRDGNYEPGNCRWATPKEQAENSDKLRKAWKKFRTHCPKGHEFSPENTKITPKGNRRCRKCDNARATMRRSSAKRQ